MNLHGDEGSTASPTAMEKEDQRLLRFLLPWLRGNGPLLAYVLLIVGNSAFFSRTYVAGLQTTQVEMFSRVFIPLLTAFIHLLLLRLLPLAAYWAIAALDFLANLGIATYHDYFRENLDAHLILNNLHEGTYVLPVVFDYIPKTFLIVGTGVLLLQCSLASVVRPRLGRWLLIALAGVVIPLFAVAVYKVPLSSAARVTDYALAIKVHGYYTALLSDLIYSGQPPPEEVLLAEQQKWEKTHPMTLLNVSIPPPHTYDSLLAIQVESLDYNILDFTFQGREVTPFLNRLKDQAIVLKLRSFHYGASGSSGSDYQFLTGRLPLRTYPTFRLRSMDYSQSLPAVYARKGIETFAFHGNTASMWGRGWAYKRMGVARFFDVDDFPRPDARWGVSDRLFFDHSRKLIEEHSGVPRFYFLITLSSHGPFNFVENPVFSGSDIVTRYFNAINYVDAALGQFLTTLKGRYLVILYGDHAANVHNEWYRSNEGNTEYVPGFIFLAENGQFSRPPCEGDLVGLDAGTLDIRSLHYLARSIFP